MRGLAGVALLAFLRIVVSPDPALPAHGPEATGGKLWAQRSDTPSSGPRHLDLLASLPGESGPGGSLVADADLAALAFKVGSATSDTDARRFPGLRTIPPD